MNTKEQIEKLQIYLAAEGSEARLGSGLLVVEILEKLQELESLHRFLDMRDQKYFRWCKTGI